LLSLQGARAEESLYFVLSVYIAKAVEIFDTGAVFATRTRSTGFHPFAFCLFVTKHDQEIVRDLWEQRMNQISDIIDVDASETFSSFGQESVSYAHARIQLKRLPLLVESLGLCYLGMFILRLPIFIGDLLSWIKHGDFMYMYAANDLPTDMQRRLHAVHRMHLNPSLVPDVVYLRTATHNILESYSKELGMTLPQLNVSLCLFRLINVLRLPIEVYSATKKLFGLIETKLEVPKHSDRRRGRHDGLPDETLAAYFVLAVKLLHPFDQKARNPTLKTEPSTASVDWRLWKQTIDAKEKLVEKELTQSWYISSADARNVTENDLLSMGDDQIDQYLDWIVESVAKPREDDVLKKNDFAKDLLVLFPIEKRTKMRMGSSHSPSNEYIDRPSAATDAEVLQGGLIVRQIVSRGEGRGTGSNFLRPGEDYRIYHDIQDLGSGIAWTFYEAVAECIGISLEQLVVEVASLDNRFFKWMREERKQ
jgi:RNA polymerase I-specific transcription initiation factor RRN7